MRCYTRALCQQENIQQFAICESLFNIIRNIIPGFDHCSHIPEPPPGLLSDLGGPGQPGICWFEGDTTMKGKPFERVSNKHHIPTRTYGNTLEALELSTLTKKPPTNPQLRIPPLPF